MKIIINISLFVLFLLIKSVIHAEEMTYTLISDPKAHIENERNIALEENKKLLWILGSQWCHDSRSLEQKLKLDGMTNILSDNYRLSMIDVSYLSEGFEFTEVAGMQTFYATPTVLIFDPITMKQLNATDMHIWSHAYTVKEDETIEYFSRYAEVTPSGQSIYSERQLELLDQLNAYVSEQESRILNAFKTLGPMLEAYKKGEVDDNFDPYWDTLAELRKKLPNVISANRDLIERAEYLDKLTLDLPDIEPFPWEMSEVSVSN